MRYVLGTWLLALVLLLSGWHSFAQTSAKPLYLSYSQRVAFSYALLAYGRPEHEQHEILKRAAKYFGLAALQKGSVVKVKSFAEFLAHYRGSWPSTQSLEIDMQYVERAPIQGLVSYEAESPRIQKQIDQYQKNQLAELNKLAEADSKNAKQFMQTPELVGAAVSILNGDFKSAEGFTLKANEKFFTEKLSVFDTIGEKIVSTELGQSQDVAMRLLVETMFSQYFGHLSLDSKKLMVSSFIGQNLNMTDVEKFELMVQNSGPQLQKLLQVVARQGDIGENMLKIFQRLEDAVRPVPWIQVNELMNKETGNYQFIYFEREPIGVGTMAQVHRAKILVNGKRQDVVVRFMKPGIGYRVEEDNRILRVVAAKLDANPEYIKTGMPRLSPLVEDITKTVRAELDQNATIERQTIAKARYEKEVLLSTHGYKNYLEFRVPGIYAPKEQNSLFMVQEMIFGRKIDKETSEYQKLAPDMKKAIVEQLVKMWANELLFGSGFYHSDLHHGNFLVSVSDEHIRLSILDFGMGGKISYNLQRQVLVLGAGIELMSADMVAKSFWSISDKKKNTISETDFKNAVRTKMGMERHNSDETSFDTWTTWALREGLALPYDFISLNRGILIMNKLLEDASSKESVGSMIKVLGLENANAVYRRLVIEEGMSLKELGKLGWVEFKDRLQKAKSRDVLRCEAVFL